MKQLATQTGCETCSSHFAQFRVKSCLLSQEQRSALLSSLLQKAMNHDRLQVQIGSAWHTMLDIIFCRNLKFYRWWDFLSFNILLNWPKGINIPLTELMRWKEWQLFDTEEGMLNVGEQGSPDSSLLVIERKSLFIPKHLQRCFFI